MESKEENTEDKNKLKKEIILDDSSVRKFNFWFALIFMLLSIIYIMVGKIILSALPTIPGIFMLIAFLCMPIMILLVIFYLIFTYMTLKSSDFRINIKIDNYDEADENT